MSDSRLSSEKGTPSAATGENAAERIARLEQAVKDARRSATLADIAADAAVNDLEMIEGEIEVACRERDRLGDAIADHARGIIDTAELYERASAWVPA